MGATDHVYNSLQGFKENKQLSDGKIYLYMGNATKVVAVAMGDLHLTFGRDRILILKNYPFVPLIRRNLVSVSSLVKNGYSVILIKE